nr:broad-complex core protein isoforms 1/2/3/4/5-like isoform X1 [Cherax quadricarinatus]
MPKAKLSKLESGTKTVERAAKKSTQSWKRPRGSVVWLYFQFDSPARRRTVCSLCNHSIGWDPNTNSTSNMLKHMRSKHPEHLETARQQGDITNLVHTYYAMGLPSQDIHGSGEFSHNNGEDVPVAVSPEQYLAEQSEREPTPPPPTPTPQKPESYQLRHNNHLTIVLEALARDESFMDVTLTAQGRSLKAHKSVLSAVSPYFRGVLRDNPCQHPIIIMPRDVRFEELFSIVNYIYKGEMTVAAEDLTSLLKTAEILQVSGLAPSDSSATVNPHTDCSTAGNVRSSSASSSSSSSNLASASRPSRTVKTSSHQTSTPPARPKSRDSMINPTDFMDVDMTCVKEEVQSADEEENEEQITKDSSSQPPGKLDPTFQQNLSTFSPSYDPLDHPTTSTSSVHDTSPALPVKSDPDVTADINVIAEDPHPFTCPHCQEHHREMDTLVTHLRVRHPSKASFTCGCGRVYTRQMYHQAHARVCSNTS